MKLTTKLLLKPTPEQKQVLLDTMKQANAACDSISQWCWENKTFGQYKIHHGNYHTIKGSFYLSAQMVIRCIAKVCDSYKLDKKRQRSFRKYGSVAYDSRILSYKGALASIWTIEGRQKIPFVTAEHHAELLKYAQGEADLAYVRGKLYLLQTCDVPHEAEQEFDDCIGVDLGITNIASTAGAAPDDTDIYLLVKNGISFASIDRKFVKLSEVCITAGLSINCKVLFSTRPREGIPVYFVPSRYTSKTCHSCNKIGKRDGEKFTCETCSDFYADANAAKNIRALGLNMIQPESSALFGTGVPATGVPATGVPATVSTVDMLVLWGIWVRVKVPAGNRTPL